MSRQSLYIHGINLIEINGSVGAHAQNLILRRQSAPDPFEIYAFAPDAPPAVTVDNVDVHALISAARQALRALREAHEGDPVSLPLGVSEALDAIADVLEGR
jgi:hypothetical protein